MLKHIVMWKLQDFAEGRNKKDNANMIRDMLISLQTKIPEIKAVEVGINVNSSADAYDAVLYSEFNNEKDLKTYLEHPEHKKISGFVKKVRIDRKVVDYLC